MLDETFGGMSDSISESQRMALEDHATHDAIQRIHLQSDRNGLLISIISPLTSPGGGLLTNGLESLMLSNQDEVPLDVSFFARSRLSELRHLELSGCKISSWDHLASQTTHLTALRLFSDRVSPRSTILQLLSILASDPHLQDLALNAHTVPNDDGGGSSYQVPLRHLE